ncbi:uncharacterized protein RAG0_13625 [Rhynchosporium agropyri]|uniref:MADS-box domain-containing protein n=2 Tax=Rhynchosporium TaxID=38037 RepID=A0A1E1LE13_9HELO|nr:uncharacterized protein RAG0_13625 [Rhynchosporium agropyri]
MAPGLRKAAKRENERVRRKEDTLFVNTYRLSKESGVKVAVMVLRGGRYRVYSSPDWWPPSKKEIAGTYPLPKILQSDELERKIAARSLRVK